MSGWDQTPNSTLAAKRPVRRRLYETLIGQLQDQIEASSLGVGSRIPSERALADQFGVSRVTVKQALIALEARGLLEIRHGDGVFVAASTPADESPPAVADRRRKLSDIIQAREIVEVQIAGIAAERRNDRDLAAMAAALTHDGSAALGSPSEAMQQTLSFHTAVAAATHNEVLVDVVNHLVRPVTQVFNPHQANPNQSDHEHRQIYQAIKRGDAAAAREAMAAHIDHFGQIQMPRL